VSRLWDWLAGLITAQFRWILLAAVVATVGLAFGLPRIHFKTGQDTFLESGSKVYQDNLRYQGTFGGDPMLVLFEGDVLDLLAQPNLDTLRDVEQELSADPRFFTVVSPLTILQLGLEQTKLQQEDAIAKMTGLRAQAEASARQQTAAAGGSQAEQDAAAQTAGDAAVADFIANQGPDAQRFQQIGELSLDNPKVPEFILFDAEGNVRPEMADVIPDRYHSLMVVRLGGNMSMDEQAKAADDVSKLVRAHSFQGFKVLPSGPAILIEEINNNMRTNLIKTAALATVLMVVVLSLVFRASWRLLSLPVMLAGCIWAFGLMGFLSLPMTMVTISGLPILIGLGVDFAIQFHSRFDEELQKGASATQALRESLPRIGAAISVAVLAASAGFMVLHISRVPMIRDFGSMLTVGTIILFVACLLLLHAVLYARQGDHSMTRRIEAPAARFQVENVVRSITTNTVGRVLPVLTIGLFVVLLGVFLDQRLPLQTEPERFIPQDSQVLKDLYYIRDTTGSTSELGLMVQADDVLRSDILAWMQDFQETQMARHSQLLRVNSLATLLTSANNGVMPSPEQTQRLLDVVPPGIRSSMINDDHTGASVIFSIGELSLVDRRAILNDVESNAYPPPGVSLAAGGLAVIGAETTNALSQNRGLMTIAALGAICLGLFAIYRNPAKAVLPLLPIVLALSASSVVLYLLGIELNPLTSVSGPLIIAMGTEFTVLLMSRYFEEREMGNPPRVAMDIASLRIGRAIAASGLTVIGGFGALVFSNFPLIESFGQVTVLDMALCLLATLVVLPPLLVWLDEETGLVAVRKQLRPVE
jgi:hydrophobe/amphiphile efflux-3 (HAE3) family protein